MSEMIQEKTITTELRPFLRAVGWNFYMSLKCCSGENSDIFNVIDDMRFKLVISWKDDKREDSQMEVLFESAEWVGIDFSIRDLNGFEYNDGDLDIYELTQGGNCHSINLSNCLEDIFEDYEEDEREEQIEELEEEIIENMTGEGDLDDLMEKAVTQYIKTYF